MPDQQPYATDIARALGQYQRRLRLVSAARGLLASSAAAAVFTVVLATLGWPPAITRVVAVLAFITVSVGICSFVWQRTTLARVAGIIESRTGGFDNLLITAEEMLAGRRARVHPAIAQALLAQAHARLRAVDPRRVVPPAAPLVTSAAAILAAAVLVVTLTAPQSLPIARGASATASSPATLGLADVRVIVTPPAYARRPRIEALNPERISVLEGSRVRLETRSDHPAHVATAGDTARAAFAIEGGVAAHEFTASTSRALIVQRSADSGVDARLLQVQVQPDRRPLVRIRTPAKDLMFAQPQGQVPIEIEATDDVGLAALTLRYTRMAGSGETFTFEEGELPVQIAAPAGTSWNGRSTIALDALKLEDGDTLVYRAVARDHKPGADPAASETFVIEIGKLAGIASTGFALPEEPDRQAISQQMVIIKTERLHAARATLSPDALLEQSRLLAVEQRMVRAEFVFMTGGEVADEVEEAEHAHELAEGRLENQGQAELLAAIREMSRAETRLNAADTQQALVFERAALKALQRAFDRRRYLLRTLPERTRIDPARRLTGDRSKAQSTTVPVVAVESDEVVARVRRMLPLLAAAAAPFRHRPPDRASWAEPALAAEALQIDPDDEALQRAAAALAAATTHERRALAARDVHRILLRVLQSRVGRGGSGRLPSASIDGRVADELQEGDRAAAGSGNRARGGRR